MKNINLRSVVTLSILSSALSIASSYGANIDQRTNDITVLQAWMGDEITALTQPGVPNGGNLNLSLCNKINNTYLGMDCATVIPTIEKTSSDSALPALATSFGFPIQGGLCQTWEIRTVTKLSAFNSPTFTGIGFSFEHGSADDQYIESGSNIGVFVPKAQLDQVGVQVTLKDGEAAIVHRFIGQGACNANGDDGYSLEFSLSQFRPYARFNTATDQYTNWDSVSSDYILGAGPHASTVTNSFVSSFDRQSDVLKQ